MKHRTVRILGALVALWSLVASGSPAPLHQCSMHAVRVSHTHHAGHAVAAGHASSPAHAGQAALARMDGEENPSSAPGDHDGDCCHCLTCGCAPAAVGLPSLALAVPAVRDVTIRVPALAGSQGPRITREPHVLPFGNGPPIA